MHMQCALILLVAALAVAASGQVDDPNEHVETFQLAHRKLEKTTGTRTMGSFIFPLSRTVARVNVSRALAHPALSPLLSRRLQDTVPVYGDYTNLAYFYAILSVGTPVQTFSVIADTGSSLTAFTCSTCSPTECGSHQHRPYDASASSTSQTVGCNECRGSSCSGNTCSYIVSYAEGSSISGIMYRDVTYLAPEPMLNPAPYNEFALHQFQFGCQTHEGGLFRSQFADGIMGVGHSGASIVSSLWEEGKLARKMFSLCLSLNGGAMTAGHIDSSLHGAPPVWAAMSLGAHYEVHVKRTLVGQTDTGASLQSSNTILDSGTTFTYLPSSAFAAIVSTVNSYCSAEGNVCRGTRQTVNQESVCYDLPDPQLITTFPSVTFVLQGFEAQGDVNLVVAPQHVFLKMSWNQGPYCLGFYDNRAGGAVLGANTMMGNDVIFDFGLGKDAPPGDNPSQGVRVGFAPSTCQIGQPQPSPSTQPLPPSTLPEPSQGTQPSSSPSASATPLITPTISSSGSPSGSPSPTASLAATLPSLLPSATMHGTADSSSTYTSKDAAVGGIVGAVLTLAALVCLVCLLAKCTRSPSSLTCCGVNIVITRGSTYSAVDAVHGASEQIEMVPQAPAPPERQRPTTRKGGYTNVPDAGTDHQQRDSEGHIGESSAEAMVAAALSTPTPKAQGGGPPQTQPDEDDIDAAYDTAKAQAKGRRGAGGDTATPTGTPTATSVVRSQLSRTTAPTASDVVVEVQPDAPDT